MGKYASSPQWSDITPIPLSDDPLNQQHTTSSSPSTPRIQPLASIAYPPSYREAMSYLRAVMAKNEFSLRALQLTEDIIGMNPAHYTVWLYRAKILKELDADVYEELAWLEGVARRNLKNYQICPGLSATHRTNLPNPNTRPRHKNYHVWAYRHWLCARFPDQLLLHPDELARTETMIDDDVRNNSAWNHRWFLVFGAEDLKSAGNGLGGLKELELGKLGAGGTGPGIVDEDVVEREIAYAQAKIYLAPQNPSPWAYLRGVLRRASRPLSDLEDFCLEFVGQGGDIESENAKEGTNGGVRSSHAVEWLGEIWGRRGEVERAATCWEALGSKWDPIRRGYWEYRRERLEKEAGVGAGMGEELDARREGVKLGMVGG